MIQGKYDLKEVSAAIGINEHQLLLILHEVAEGRFLIGKQYCLKSISDKTLVPIEDVNKVFYVLLRLHEVNPTYTCFCKVCGGIAGGSFRSANAAFFGREGLCVHCGTHLETKESISILIEFFKKDIDLDAVLISKNLEIDRELRGAGLTIN